MPSLTKLLQNLDGSIREEHGLTERFDKTKSLLIMSEDENVDIVDILEKMSYEPNRAAAKAGQGVPANLRWTDDAGNEDHESMVDVGEFKNELYNKGVKAFQGQNGEMIPIKDLHTILGKEVAAAAINKTSYEVVNSILLYSKIQELKAFTAQFKQQAQQQEQNRGNQLVGAPAGRQAAMAGGQSVQTATPQPTM